MRNVITAMRYRDAPRMIEWLCSAFGFDKKAVYESGGLVMHAELTFGNGMVMIGSAGNQGAATAWSKQPDETGGAETQTPYLVVDDCDAVYAKAVAAGAKILIPLEDKGHGGKAFTCADPEGHIWNVGSYDPWT